MKIFDKPQSLGKNFNKHISAILRSISLWDCALHVHMGVPCLRCRMSISPHILVASFPWYSASTHKVPIVGCDSASTCDNVPGCKRLARTCFSLSFYCGLATRTKTALLPTLKSDGENGTPPDCSAL